MRTVSTCPLSIIQDLWKLALLALCLNVDLVSLLRVRVMVSNNRMRNFTWFWPVVSFFFISGIFVVRHSHQRLLGAGWCVIKNKAFPCWNILTGVIGASWKLGRKFLSLKEHFTLWISKLLPVDPLIQFSSS